MDPGHACDATSCAQECRVVTGQRTALIFGVSGQDGAYLARLLLNKGYHVHGTSRDAEMAGLGGLIALGIRERITVHSAALADFRSVLQAVQRVEPDEIYNLAGQSSVGLSFQQPAETLESVAMGTLTVLEVLRELGGNVRFYNAGSSECFGDTGGVAADEATAFRPRSPYGVAKAAAHWQVANYRESYGLFACSGILFNHESPLRPTRFVTAKIASAAARIALGASERLALGDLSIRRDWGWAEEYVDVMWRMLQQSTAQDYVVATGEASLLEDFVAAAFAALDLRWRDHVDHDSALIRPSDIRVGFGNASRAERELGWKAQVKMPDIARRLAIAAHERLTAAGGRA